MATCYGNHAYHVSQNTTTKKWEVMCGRCGCLLGTYDTKYAANGRMWDWEALQRVKYGGRSRRRHRS